MITAVETTSGKELDPPRLQPLLEQHQQNTQKAAHTAAADMGDGAAENYRRCQAAGVVAAMAAGVFWPAAGPRPWPCR